MASNNAGKAAALLRGPSPHQSSGRSVPPTPPSLDGSRAFTRSGLPWPRRASSGALQRPCSPPMLRKPARSRWSIRTSKGLSGGRYWGLARAPAPSWFARNHRGNPKGGPVMDHYVGLDVSVRETSVCVVDETGKLLKEAKVPTEPEAIAALLGKGGFACKRVGLEAGPISQWLYAELAAAGLPVICVEAQYMRSALSAQCNKTDRNDARGIAQMMRVGLCRPVHVKTLPSQERRLQSTEGEASSLWKLAGGPAHRRRRGRGLDETARPSDPIMRRPGCRPRKEAWPLGMMPHAKNGQTGGRKDVYGLLALARIEKFHTTSTSPWRSTSSSTRASSGWSALAPDAFSGWVFSQPARRSASSWSSGN